MADAYCIAEVKTCPKCGETKGSECFGRHAKRKDGLQVYCKRCTKALRDDRQYDKARWENSRELERARNLRYRTDNADALKASYRENARRRRAEFPDKVNATNKTRKATQRNAVPVWADRSQILMMYSKAREWSALLGVDLHVDHIVPIRGKTVCGLHTPDNLQILAADLNHKKRHWHWPDMP